MKRALVLTSIAATTVFAVALALPSLALRAARVAVEQRFGMGMTAATTEAGWGEVRFRDARLGQAGEPATLEVEDLRIVFQPLLVWRGASALQAIEIEGADLLVRVPGPLDAAAASPAPPQVQLAAFTPSSRASTGMLERLERRLPIGTEVLVRDLAIRMQGPDGPVPLIHALDARIERRKDRLSVSGLGTPVAGGSFEWDLTYATGTRTIQGDIDIEGFPLVIAAARLPAIPWYRPERGRLDLELAFDEAASGQPQPFAATARVHDLGLWSERLAEAPVELELLELIAAGHWNPGRGRVELDRGDIRMNGLPLEIAGAIELAETASRVDLVGRLPVTDCGRLIDAAPRGVLGEFAGFEMSGTVGGRVELVADSRSPDDLQLDFAVDDRCRFDGAPYAADLHRFTGPFVHRVREDDAVHELVTGPGSADWASLERISPYTIHAVLAHEDAAFFRHEGFAPWAIRTAMIRNWKEERFALGASTISMQLARNLFLERDKTLTRKVREALLTWYLERSLTKQEILELYLNVIEYGPGVYGIEQAARHYFERPAATLTPAQSAFLASVLPAPKVYSRSYEQGTLTPQMHSMMADLLLHMHRRERLDDAAFAYARDELDRFDFGAKSGPVLHVRDLPGRPGDLPVTTAWDRRDELVRGAGSHGFVQQGDGRWTTR